MAQYVIQIRGKKGIQSLELNASTVEIARRQGKRFGMVLSVRRKRAGLAKGGLSQSERYILLVRLATMLASKVGSTEALRLIRDSFRGKISNVASQMLERVELGVDLPTVMAEDRKNFPGAVALIIKAGAQTGQTYRALQEAADFEKQIADLKKNSKMGMISAIGGFFIAGILLIVSIFYIGPKVMNMGLMAQNKDKINTVLVDTISLWGGIFMIVVLVALAGLFWLSTVGRRFFPNAADRIIIKIPFFSDLILAQQNYVNLYRLSLMVRSGVRMEEALQTSFEACGRGALKSDFNRALQALKKGQKWASGMTILHATDRAALMLASDRDQIATNLNNVAAQYNSIYLQRIQMFTPTLQVLSAFAMSLSGFSLFGTSVLPMLQVSANMMN